MQKSLVSHLWGHWVHLGAEAPWDVSASGRKGLGLWATHAFLPAPAVGRRQPRVTPPGGPLARASQSSCTFLGDHHTWRKDGGFCFHNATYVSKQVILPIMTW